MTMIVSEHFSMGADSRLFDSICDQIKICVHMKPTVVLDILYIVCLSVNKNN